MYKKVLMLVFVALVTVAFFGLGANGLAGSGKQIVLKYAELAPKMVRTEAAMWWIDQVHSRTGGRVKIEYYPGQSLVKAKDMPEAIRSGLCDIATFVTVYYPSKVPAWTMADVASISDAYATMMAYYDLYASEPALQKDLDKWNCRLLFPQTAAGETVMVFRSQVKSVAEIKGLKIRAVGDQAHLLKALGASPVPVPHPEIFTALQTGTLDGALGFPSQAMSFGYYEVTKTWLRGAPGRYLVPAMINKNTWNKLPKDIQKILWETGRDQVRYLASWQNCKEGQIIETVQNKYGVKVINLTPAEVKHWRAQYAPIWKKWIADKKKRGIPGERLLKRYWELTAKYGAPLK